MQTIKSKFFILFATVLTLGICSCGGDDDEDYQWNDNQNTSQTDQDQNASDESSNGNESGNNTSYEKPDISFDRVTAQKTTLRVYYKINNKKETDISEAKIYFGTNSNPHMISNASISGDRIIAFKGGLKSGTTYYVKCKATGKGGTTTTSTTKCKTK